MALVRLEPRSGENSTPIAVSSRGPRRLFNVMYHAGRYVRRLGTQAVNSVSLSLAVAGDYLIGAWALKVAPAGGAAVCDIYVGSSGTTSAGPGIFKQVGSALVPVPYNGVTVSPTTTPWFPWVAAEMSDVAAAVCKRGTRISISSISNTGKLLHQSPTQITQMGIAGPTAAPSISNAGGGTLPAGTWRGSYTFVTDDGHESNESADAAVTTGANELRRWASLQVSTHPRVTVKNLYLTREGADNVTRYFLAQIPNSATTYDESLADSTLGFKTAPITNGLPPEDPEHVSLFDECLFVTSNDPNFGGPGWPYTYVDSDLIPQFEAFDVDRRVLRIPPRGGQRAMASCVWNGQGLLRLALATDASIHVATPGAEDQVYEVTGLDDKHGIAGPACIASGEVEGASWLVWFDGERVRASDGSAPFTISTDDVDAALKSIPEGYAERACVAFRRGEGGYFAISFASTASSTYNDLELRWSPADRESPRGGWSEAGYLYNGSTFRAPMSYGSAPSGAVTRLGIASTAIDLATFYEDRRVFWQDSPALRDEGPIAVYVEVDFPAVADQDGAALVCGRGMVSYGNRRDIDASTTVVPELSFRLVLDPDTDATRTTSPIAALRQAGVLHSRSQNIGDSARVITLRMFGLCTPAVEFGPAWLDVASIGLRRAV